MNIKEIFNIISQKFLFLGVTIIILCICSTWPFIPLIYYHEAIKLDASIPARNTVFILPTLYAFSLMFKEFGSIGAITLIIIMTFMSHFIWAQGIKEYITNKQK